MMSEEMWLTLQEAADALNLSVSTIRRRSGNQTWMGPTSDGVTLPQTPGGHMAAIKRPAAADRSQGQPTPAIEPIFGSHKRS
jgi:hypothetical protein